MTAKALIEKLHSLIDEASKEIERLSMTVGHLEAQYRHLSGLHDAARAELREIDKLVTHGGCGSTAARITAELAQRTK